MTLTRIPMLPKLLGWPLALHGVASLLGGAWLVGLAEAPLYLAASVVMGAAGWLLFRGRRAEASFDGLPLQATPMSFKESDGRQYVVVVAGAHGSLGSWAGDRVIAYALRP